MLLERLNGAHAYPSYSMVLMMKPSVGLTLFTSSFMIFLTIVVLPALSRPLPTVSLSPCTQNFGPPTASECASPCPSTALFVISTTFWCVCLDVFVCCLQDHNFRTSGGVASSANIASATQGRCCEVVTIQARLSTTKQPLLISSTSVILDPIKTIHHKRAVHRYSLSTVGCHGTLT